MLISTQLLRGQLVLPTNEIPPRLRLATTRPPLGSALVDQNDKVFPQIMFGGGWETVVVVVNIGFTPIHYNQLFFGTDGKPLQVTFKTYPDQTLITTTATDSNLPPNTSFNYSLFDDGGPIRTGWSVLSYDSTKGRLSGYALVRHRATTGQFNFEATVPLSNLQDFAFFMPVDNIQGFRTVLALVNPSLNKTANVTLQFIGLDGTRLFSDSGALPPGQQMSLSIPDLYPTLANQLATVLVQADISLFSAAGFRLNDVTGAVASVPIMNWEGMFQ